MCSRALLLLSKMSKCWYRSQSDESVEKIGPEWIILGKVLTDHHFEGGIHAYMCLYMFIFHVNTLLVLCFTISEKDEGTGGVCKLLA